MSLKELKKHKESIICNCDGFWHVSIKDSDGEYYTHYIDISPLVTDILNEVIGPDEKQGKFYHSDRIDERNALRAEYRTKLLSYIKGGE
jgi:hypothetical protein